MARIIIADDDDLVTEIACDALIGAGHDADALSNGRDAIQAIRANKPDLVILDCNMPKMNGLHVCRELRDSAEFARIPVLILTGRSSDFDVEVGYYEGATDYMTKPFASNELVLRVEALLSKHQFALHELA
jgi:DNA-binding response OmpR family regulator